MSFLACFIALPPRTAFGDLPGAVRQLPAGLPLVSRLTAARR